MITSFLVGLLTFLSPCSLPVIPVFAALLLPSTKDEVQTGKGLLRPLLFVLGLGGTFFLAGLTVLRISQHFVALTEFFRIGGAVFLTLAALATMFDWHLPSIKLRALEGDVAAIGPLLLGILTGISWVPCVGIHLGTIFTYTAARST